MTLTDFLLARIAEDEEWARRDAEREAAWVSEHQGASVAFHRFHLDRVLAECEAKRQLLVREDNLICTCWSPDPEDVPTDWRDRSRVLMHHDDCTCLAVAAVLALPYADHPDYRQEWKP